MVDKKKTRKKRLKVPKPKETKDRLGLIETTKALLKPKKKVCKAIMFNNNNTVTKYKIVPSRKQFSIKNSKYIWDSSAACWDHKERIFTAIYYEDVPIPVKIFSDGNKLTFDTVDSDTFTQVQKMEYIKTLAQTGQISKILKNVFLVVVVTLFGHIATLALLLTKVLGAG